MANDYLMAAELHKLDINAVLMDSDIDLIADIIDTMFRAAVARAENMADREVPDNGQPD